MTTSGAAVAPRLRVALDAMGGDYAPHEIVKGAAETVSSRDDVEILLVGDAEPTQAELARYDVAGKPIKFVPSVGRVGDDEHPVSGLRRKPQASILVAAKLLQNGQADALVSMGSTGATMASAVMLLGLMEGLERPCLGGPFLGFAPRTVLLDMGSNVDCRPHTLLSFAVLGSVFAREYLGIENPRVGLLSVGAEDAKGNRQVQESIPVFRQSNLNFVGNVEGMDFFTNQADVIVCDGFVGNILLKFTEGFGAVLSGYVKRQLASLLPPAELETFAADLWQRTNLPKQKGGPLFGVNKPVVVGHGASHSDGVAGAIDMAAQYARLNLIARMREELAEMRQQMNQPRQG